MYDKPLELDAFKCYAERAQGLKVESNGRGVKTRMAQVSFRPRLRQGDAGAAS